MTALGHKLRLLEDWAAGLPIALISLAFLIFFYGTLEREFSERVALAATGILATSAFWIAYTFAAVPDLPMTAFLSIAVLIALFDTRPNNRGGGVNSKGLMAGGFLGV